MAPVHRGHGCGSKRSSASISTSQFHTKIFCQDVSAISDSQQSFQTCFSPQWRQKNRLGVKVLHDDSATRPELLRRPKNTHWDFVLNNLFRCFWRLGSVRQSHNALLRRRLTGLLLQTQSVWTFRLSSDHPEDWRTMWKRCRSPFYSGESGLYHEKISWCLFVSLNLIIIYFWM